MNKLPSIIILPGWKVPSSRYIKLKEFFTKEGYDTYVFGFIGFEPDKPLGSARTLNDYSKDVEDFISVKKIKNAVLIGHSFGGRVGICLASLNPLWLSKLILTGTPGFAPVGSIKKKIFLLVSKIGKVLFWVPLLSQFSIYARKLLYRLSGSVDYLTTDGYLRETFQSIIREELESYMKKIKVPTLLIWGESDSMVSIFIAEKMKETIQNCKLEVIPLGNHGIPFQNAEEFFSVAQRFINKTDL